MLELFLLIRLSKTMGSMAEDRGVSKALHIILLIVFWFIGEISGGFIGAIVGAIAFEMDDPLIPAIIGAICGAACGALLAFGLVSLHSPRPKRTFDDEEEQFDKAFQPRRLATDEQDGRSRPGPNDRNDDENQYRVRPAQ